MRSVAIVAAAAGTATFAALVRLPPGTAAGRPAELVAAVTTSSWYLTVLVVAVMLLVARVLAVRRGGDDLWQCAEPVLLGAGAPLLSLLLDPWSFHSTVWVTVFTGVALGALAGLARLRRLPAKPALSDRQALALLVALAIGIPTFLALPGPPWFHPVSGDEPHYLVIARSLWLDGDVDVSDDYQEPLAPFWYGELLPHAKPGADPAEQYSIHGSGLAVWLAPWFGLGRGLSEEGFNALVRFAMTWWLAAAAVALYFLLRDLAGRAVALPGTALAVLTLPLLFAGAHLFPAVPVFALSCGAYVLLRGGALPARALLAGLMLACLPWLHFKFFGLMVAVGAAGMWFMHSRSKEIGSPDPESRTSPSEPSHQPVPGRMAVAALAVPMVASGMAHLAFTWRLYRRLSPLAIHVGADPTLRATAEGDDWLAYLTDPLGAATTFIGYFLDQREGLLFYAPHYLLAAAGLAWLWHRRRADAVALVLALLALAGPYALSQETGHWAPPARPLTGVLWTLAAGAGIGLMLPAGPGRAGKARAAVRAVLVTWGVGATAMLLLQPDLLYHDFNVGRSLALLRYGAPGLPLAETAPLWLGPDAVHWGVSLVGLAGALALAAWFWRWGVEAAATRPGIGGGSSPPGPARAKDADSAPDTYPGVSPRISPDVSLDSSTVGHRAAAAFLALAALVMLVHHAFVPVTGLHESWDYRSARFWRPQSPPTRAWGEPEGLWTGGHDTVNLLLSTREPVDRIIFELDTLAPMQAEIQLGRDRQSVRLDPGSRTLARLQPGPASRWNGEYFYHLEVVAHGGVSPAALGLGDDGRGLGVRLRVLQVAARER